MNNGETIKNGLDDFRQIQKCILLACKENASETYAELKEIYLSIKALLILTSNKICPITPTHERHYPELYRIFHRS